VDGWRASYTGVAGNASVPSISAAECYINSILCLLLLSERLFAYVRIVRDEQIGGTVMK